MSKKKLDFEAVRTEFLRAINLWLDEEKRQREKLVQLNTLDSSYEFYRRNANIYSSMAHALVMTGRNLGVIADRDFPQFESESEKRGNAS